MWSHYYFVFYESAESRIQISTCISFKECKFSYILETTNVYFQKEVEISQYFIDKKYCLVSKLHGLYWINESVQLENCENDFTSTVAGTMDVVW